MRKLMFASAAILAALAAAPAMAQNIASMTGVVTDTAGAVIPHTGVVLTDPATGASFTQTTNDRGAYRFPNVPPGQGYVATFTHDGFVSETVKGIALQVGITRTQDAKLVAGSNQTVEVSAGGSDVTINTTDAQVGNNIDPQVVNSIPVQSRLSPTALFNLQPGLTPSESNNGASNQQRQFSITGARTDQNYVTVDGMDVNDLAVGTGLVITGNAPVDSVEEFRGTVGGFSTDSGPGGGGQFQLVTKSGTNHFHGDLNEYHRDTATTANQWFNNNTNLPRTPLILNQFGGAIGGPIKKDKLFFYFDDNNYRQIASVQINRIVPLDSYRAGNLSYIRATDAVTGATCTAASRQNTTPNCIGSVTPAQVQALDPAAVGENAGLFSLINSRYPHANNVAGGGDGVNTGYDTFNYAEHTNIETYVGKIDFQLTRNQRIFGRGTVNHQNGVENAPEFSTDALASPELDRSYSFVVGHTWQIGSNKVNQFTFGEVVSDLGFPIATNPTDPNELTSGNGTGGLFIADPYFSAINGQTRRVPIWQWNENFQWQKGAHSWEFGGFFKYILPSSAFKLDYNQATIGLGGNLDGLTSAVRPAGIRTAGTTSSQDWDSAFAYSLGRVGNIAQQFNYSSNGTALPLGTGAIRNYSTYQTQAYVGDTWKITPSLTLSYGVNYQILSVPYERNGLESVTQQVSGSTVSPFSFDSYFATRVAQSAAGQSGAGVVPIIQYVLGGKANNGPGYYNPSWNNFAPRFAFAYSPEWDRKTVFNGSIGMVYDRTVVNAVQYQQDQHNWLFQQTHPIPYGDQTNPVGSLQTDPRLNATAGYAAPGAPAAATAPYQPYVNATASAAGPAGPAGILNAQSFNTTIDHNLKTPYSILAGFGMQHEFPLGFVFKANWVGRFGRRLLAEADSAQVIDFPDKASGELLSTAFAHMTTEVRAGANTANLPAEPWMENQFAPGFGATQTYTDANGVVHHYPNNTSYLADNITSIVYNGDFGDFMQGISSGLAQNVGMSAQFANNAVYTNKGFSSYNGLLLTIHKNMSHGLQFDVNYTFQHSIDNTSLIANDPATSGSGFICDAARPKECRGNSDFDVTQITNADFVYQLPFGHGREFASSVPKWLDEVIGGWDVSSILTQHTGYAYQIFSNAFVAGYSNDAAAFFNGPRKDVAAHVNKTSSGSVSLYTNSALTQSEFSGPVGFAIGPRNNFRGPGYFNMDSGLAKKFGILPDRGINLTFRADFYNVLNHASFATPVTYTNSGPPPAADFTQGSFGILSQTASTARVGQFALRLEF